MRRQRKPRQFPVSQRELAVYYGISPTLLSMTETGRHGPRNLSSGSLKKKREIFLAHEQTKNSNAYTTSLKKIQDRIAIKCEQLAKKMSGDANYADSTATVLKRRLDEMVRNEQQDSHWMKTLDLLLARLPKTKESANDRIWLENQQVVTEERLQKNGRLAQVKLETQIELEKARARIYRDILKKLSGKKTRSF